MRKIKPLLAIVILLLGILGGTARMRPESGTTPPDVSTAPAVEIPSPSPEVDIPEQLPPPEEPVVETPEPEPEYFTLNFVGDCTLASSAYYQGSAQGYDTVINGDWAYPFALTVDLFTDDDMTFANLECALTESTAAAAKTFTFKAGAEYAQILTEGNVEFVTLANNHVLDFGQQGYADTKAALDELGIAYAGRDEYTLYETESGLKVGVYAVSFGSVEQIKAGIAAVKALEPDFIIAAMHWGDEGSYSVNADQIAQAHACIDAGADFVYGSHPHTLQPYEEYQGKYIYYSMGNWTFGGNTDPRDNDTFILRLTLERSVDGSVKVIERKHIPAACSGIENGNNYQPVLYEEGSEEYERVLSKLDGSFTGQNLSIGYSYSANE